MAYRGDRVTQPIDPGLLQALQALGRPTTPEKLLAKGVTHLRSLRVSEIGGLIERAINRMLMERTIGGLDEGELRTLAAGAEAEIVRQLVEMRTLADSREAVGRQSRELQSDLSALRRRIASRRGLVEQREHEKDTPERLERRARLRRGVHALLLPLRDSASDGVPSARNVAEDLLALFAEAEVEAIAEERRAFDREADRLQRRIAKLVGGLENAERALERLARTKDLESGLASIYRAVQGLAEDERERQQKLDILAGIFRLNLELRDARSDLRPAR